MQALRGHIFVDRVSKRQWRESRIRIAPTLALVALAVAVSFCWLGAHADGAHAASLGAVTEFSAGLQPGTHLDDASPGPDGMMWTLDDGSRPAIDKIAADGTITTLPLPPDAKPTGLAPGPFGNAWITNAGATPSIIRVSADGTMTEFRAGLNPGSRPMSIELGSNGDMWFTDHGTTPAVGVIATGVFPGETAGTITEYTAGLNPGSAPGQIARGSDGNMWFTDAGSTASIGQITAWDMPGTPRGSITEFPIPVLGWTCTSSPRAIILGADGNMWFTDTGCSLIWQITPGGTFDQWGLSANTDPVSLAMGPDGNIYFADDGTKNGGIGGIGRFSPGSGSVHEFTAGLNPGAVPTDLHTGADGSLWFTDRGATPAIGQMGTGVLGPSLLPPQVSGTGQAGQPQNCSDDRWATWDGESPLYITYSANASSFQWQRDGRSITSASGRTYTPTSADVGHQLSCTVTVGYFLLDLTASSASSAITVTAGAGTTGPAGPAGAPGKRGSPGKTITFGTVPLLSCTATTDRAHRKRQTNALCTAKLISAHAALGMLGSWRATISLSGHVYASGFARCSGSKVTVVLTSLHRMVAVHERYTLHLAYGDHKRTESLRIG